jgi:hypothetical protein
MIERRIYLVRGHKVMLDADLAELYQVETGALNRAVKRNGGRFPKDFMFHLNRKETESLRCQIGISNIGISNLGRGGRRTLPYAFTEHGVAMLSSVLSSKRAVQINIVIIRAFVKLRELVATHKELAHKMEEMERTQKEQTADIATIYQMVEQLTAPAEVPPSRRIGFVTNDK